MKQLPACVAKPEEGLVFLVSEEAMVIAHFDLSQRDRGKQEEKNKGSHEIDTMVDEDTKFATKALRHKGTPGFFMSKS
jgi:hypothetical protein